ncbi:MAG: carboxymuconolactone decarboxylase family protein [Pseudomonadota bacterium]
MEAHPEIENELKSLLGELGETTPAVLNAFGQLQQATFKDGALDIKTKELIALGIAISQSCDGCIAWHNAALKKLDASVEEIADVAGVAIEMGGGLALHPATKAVRGFKQF